MITGGGAWCAESAARRFCSEGGPTARRQIFTHLDAWLHATAYSPRSYYGSLLDKKKASRQPLPAIPLVSLGCRFRRLGQASGPAIGAVRGIRTLGIELLYTRLAIELQRRHAPPAPRGVHRTTVRGGVSGT